MHGLDDDGPELDSELADVTDKRLLREGDREPDSTAGKPGCEGRELRVTLPLYWYLPENPVFMVHRGLKRNELGLGNELGLDNELMHEFDDDDLELDRERVGVADKRLLHADEKEPDSTVREPEREGSELRFILSLRRLHPENNVLEAS